LFVQTPDWQSPFSAQMALGRQSGAQVGWWQCPRSAQTFEAQSLLLPQAAWRGQLGEQAGAWQTMFVQMPDSQSPFVAQMEPSEHMGEQAPATG
jgi:hypothetical protein